MLSDFLEYHQQLLSVIGTYDLPSCSDMEQIEECFRCSVEYWHKIQQEVKARDFGSRQEEISFFKEIKPLFTGLIEYYTLRYHALLFGPFYPERCSLSERERFWRYEMSKVKRFYEHHEIFCHYIRTGATHQDESFFVRNGAVSGQYTHSRLHDLDPQTSTSHGHLLTLYRAYGLYELHIREELHKIGRYISPCLSSHFPSYK